MTSKTDNRLIPFFFVTCRRRPRRRQPYSGIRGAFTASPFLLLLLLSVTMFAWNGMIVLSARRSFVSAFSTSSAAAASTALQTTSASCYQSSIHTRFSGLLTRTSTPHRIRPVIHSVLSFQTKRLFSSSASAASSGVFMTAMEDVDVQVEEDQDQGSQNIVAPSVTNNTTSNVDMDRTWNLNGLRKEVSRLTVRCHKKIGKANQRSTKARQEVHRLVDDDDVSLDELEKCPDVDALESDVETLQVRLQQLNQLEVLLKDFKGKNVVLPEHVSSLAMTLDVNDAPPTTPERGPKKEKGPRLMGKFRRPYRRFYTSNKTEIRVGKQAEDNDELSLSPEHRDSLDWWMHASGCPGSHVVIRCHDQILDDEVVQDAAALAARQSKCNGSVIKVSLTRARDIKKPPGAKAGLVQLTGQVRTVSVNMKEAQVRLDRLDKTVLVN